MYRDKKEIWFKEKTKHEHAQTPTKHIITNNPHRKKNLNESKQHNKQKNVFIKTITPEKTAKPANAIITTSVQQFWRKTTHM